VTNYNSLYETSSESVDLQDD